ncbi:MAG TPA: response regulator [Rhizomicrobium sp.]|jgi:two-component system cell cycle response regulator CpdR
MIDGWRRFHPQPVLDHQPLRRGKGPKPVRAARAFHNALIAFAAGVVYFTREAGMAMAKILLAEDDESLRRFLASALVKAGHEVTDFGDGLEAYECLRTGPFDLLLTDIVMPGLDGIELAKRAAEMDQALKIMFITGFAAVALHPSSNAPKRAKVLSKPFHLREIVQEIDRMIAA